MAITRLIVNGHGGKMAGSFAGKGSSPHPVARLTRLMSNGHGTRLTGSFSNKGGGLIVVASEWLIHARRRIRK